MDDQARDAELVAVRELLARVDARLLRIEERIERAERATPLALAALVDSFDTAAGSLSERGVDLEERVQNALASLERVTRSDVTELLSHVVSIAGRAAEALAELERAPVAPLGAIGTLRALSDSGVQRTLGFALAFARHFGRALGADREARQLCETFSAARRA